MFCVLCIIHIQIHKRTYNFACVNLGSLVSNSNGENSLVDAVQCFDSAVVLLTALNKHIFLYNKSFLNVIPILLNLIL